MRPRLVAIALLSISAVVSASYSQAIAQEETVRIVDFASDVKPVFATHCIECHGPDDAKNDFRIDDAETVLAYLEPGDLESSSLWSDYIFSEDEDMMMPPPSKSRLTGAELATIKTWIEEGAEWPEGTEEELAASQVPEVAAKSLPERAFTFAGLFHPASVHFPVALLSISTLFLVLSYFNRESFEPAAFHCLWIGALGAVAACVMGWAYGPYRGYGADFSFDLQNSAIDRHRWLGIGVAVLALILVPMARSVRIKGDAGMRALWLLGAFCVLLGVSITGYQGGELTYGEDHYAEEFERLFPEFTAAQDETDA